MFNPSFPDEQKQLVDTARKFTAESIIPVAHEYDEKEEFPTSVFEAAFDVGLFNVEVPEEFGGLGLGVVVFLLGKGWEGSGDPS